jgi:hypothetical protein
MISLDELERRAWAGCIVDDMPECHALPDGETVEARTWFKWPQHAVETFARLLAMCGGHGGMP